MMKKTIGVFIVACLLQSTCRGAAVAQNASTALEGGVHSTEAFIKKWDRSGKGLRWKYMS
jgi:hypothetical protein